MSEREQTIRWCLEGYRDGADSTHDRMEMASRALEALRSLTEENERAHEAMRECLRTYPGYEEFDPLRRALGLPLYMEPGYLDEEFALSPIDPPLAPDAYKQARGAVPKSPGDVPSEELLKRSQEESQ